MNSDRISSYQNAFEYLSGFRPLQISVFEDGGAWQPLIIGRFIPKRRIPDVVLPKTIESMR
jgi:hypothetical protein